MDNRTSMSQASGGSFLLPVLTASILTISIILSVPVSFAGNPSVPWECSNYSGDAQTRCLKTFIERQQEQIDKLEGQLQAQQNSVGQLKNQLDRQSAMSADLQRQLSHRPAITVVPPPVYPPVAAGIYLGQPWVYGSYYWYGRPFWGPRYYGHWGRRW